MGTQPPFEDRIVRDDEARRLTGLSRTRRHELSKAGQFPAKVKLSARASGYRLSDLQAWISARPRCSANTGTQT